MSSLILLLTVFWGSISAFCSFSLAVYFLRSHRHVSRSIAFMYAAEGWAMLMTVTFAIGEGIYLDSIPLWVQTWMRITMFSAAIASSVHMGVSLDRILRSQDDE